MVLKKLRMLITIVIVFCGLVPLLDGKRAEAQDVDINGESRKWNGTAWTHRPPLDRADSPSARAFHAMAYDSFRNVTVLFGGDNSGYFGDTWEWDGSTWTDVSPGSGPSARSGHAMAYDENSNVIVLFGGYNDGGYLADTWTWDGINWSLITTGSPSPRKRHALAYDVNSNVIVLFGGYYNDGTEHFYGDTWEWNGSTWTDVSPGSGPSARMNPAMAYDANSNVTVLFGGGDDDYTWKWDGSTWTGVPPGSGPSARESPAMAYDANSNVIVLFGGCEPTTSSNETWEWDGASWTNRPGRGPAA
ncbi:MAG: kelch repeat-containing protein, partial [Phycisphaerae bacterium]